MSLRLLLKICFFTICYIILGGKITMNNASQAMQLGEDEPHWDALLYKKNSIKLQQKTAFEVLEKMSFSRNDTILDIGCGDGKITLEISKRVPGGFIHGIDLSEDMIKVAKKMKDCPSNVDFSVMNAEKIIFQEAFDKIISFFTLQWIPDKSAVFRHITRLIKQGGNITLVMTDRNPYLLSTRKKLYSSYEWKEYFEYYKDPTDVIDDDQYFKYAQEAGLKNINYQEFDRSVFFDSQEELKTFIRMVSPQVKQVPEHLKNDFVDAIFSGYLEHIPEINNTKNYIQYRIKTLSATK